MADSQPASTHETSVHVFPSLETLSRAAAQHVAAHIETVLSTRDVYRLALAGGSTPETLYRLLSGVYSGRLPLEKVHIYWGDERFVPHDHPKSNVRLVRETLLDGLPLPASNVHPVPILDTAAASAKAYAATLQDHMGTSGRTFDLALLGLGGDGHTASLFPETEPALDDPEWVRVVEAPPRHDIRTRISCTLPVLNRAEQALFLVSGDGKRAALSGVLDNADASLPATHIAPREQLSWFVDAAARGVEARG